MNNKLDNKLKIPSSGNQIIFGDSFGNLLYVMNNMKRKILKKI